MINFFRKIRQQLLTENKFSRYLIYAIGEIALVMIGILLALQVNNWNEGRKEGSKEKLILIDLRDNIKINIDLIQTYVQDHVKNNRSSQIVLNALAERIPFNDSLNIHFSQARYTMNGSSYLSYLGYEELKDAGFNIITNVKLKNEVLNLFEVTYASRIKKLDWFEQIDPIREKYLYDNFILDKYSTMRPLNFKFLQNDNYYISMITALKDHRRYWIMMLRECQDESKRVLKLIEEQLNGSQKII